MILGIFTVVYILGGATPDVQIINGDFSPLSACKARADEANASKTAAPSFTKDGRPILMTLYKCQPVDKEDLDMALAKVNSAAGG